MRAAQIVLRYGLALVGTALLLFATVMGILAPTTESTLGWVIVECIGVGVLIPGLHVAIEWRQR